MNKWKRRVARAGQSELLACGFLLQKGYQVFRNVWFSGPIDIVAFKDGKYYGFDVKSFKGTHGGTKTSTQIKQRIKFLFVAPSGECFFEDEAPFKKRLVNIKLPIHIYEWLRKRKAHPKSRISVVINQILEEKFQEEKAKK